MRFIIIFIAVVTFSSLYAQTIAGDWQGVVWQPDSQDTFQYELYLEQNGNAVSGHATSTSSNGLIKASFQISGHIDDEQIIFQEIKQLSPAAPQWCLKFIKATQLSTGELSATWTATGCKDGKMLLKLKNSYTEELPLSFVGRWTGHLSQSDRPYGFYFELELNADGTGISHIVSEGAGGEAKHQLTWEEKNGGIYFQESYVDTRTQADWKWCLKSASLNLSQHNKNYELKGDWTGYIENKSPTTAACAPGTLFLTKAIVTKVVTPQTTSQADEYTKATQRSVRVDRTIQVQSKNIHIRVWDNGIVDGDILTLFLNGQRIIKEYRVNKRKWSIPVDILEGENLLILHAEALGDIPPNTVAVSIDDGVEEQVIVVSSNLEESGAILVQPFNF